MRRRQFTQQHVRILLLVASLIALFGYAYAIREDLPDMFEKVAPRTNG